ncbi:MotA/TolQ/ExbB proton channel family domain protein [Bacteroidetes oral taxon 274 str. F0058]|nr:MotA/TolQ/ExbB proton channel family domain protein [Bacteroidetes oral taxon 274 str. F0058]
MKYVSNVLFWISNGLLVPVIVGLLYFFVNSILLLGIFFNQYLTHSKQTKLLKKTLDSLRADDMEKLKVEAGKLPQSNFTGFLHNIIEAPSKAYSNRLLADYEVRADAELGKYKLLTKFGPILGLMGTLIPMGPALAGLATGDVASMAYNMQIAFATTVVGLFVGAIGYVLLQIKQRWFVAELADLEFIADLKEQNTSNTTDK